ncbi:Cellulosome-anchoring protein precursor [compost metagenome]
MSGKQDIATDWSNGTDYLYKYLNDLTPGTTYFYRAYVQEGVTKYDGNIESFTTAKFTGIDVKNESGTPFTKSPSVFAISHKLYTVHVPYNTTSVNVAQNFFLGTAIPLTPAKFAVVNLDLLHEPQTANWNTPVDGNTTASIPVTLTSNLTTVCMNAPQFQMVSYSEEPITSCDGYSYEVQIIRDAAPSDSPAPPPPATTVKVIVTEHSGSVTNLPVTQLGESKLPMSAQLFTTAGVSLNLPDIKIAADGTFTLPNVPAGQYHMVLNVLAPTGEKLAGRPATLTVDASGNAQVESELIDPYGIITDAFTGNVIEGAHATLHWADTDLNRSKGRVPGDLVILPILPDFAPNQNRDPQDSNSKGEYGWMVFPDGDYYIKATKPGYSDFDSRTTGANKDDGDDSYIKNGIIHIGQSIESYDFEMEPIVKEKGTHYNYVAGYPDGTFGPDRNITRAEVAAVFARITNNYQLVLDATDKNSYNDVSNSHWAKEYIENVSESGLMLGSAESTFRPEAPITRGEVAAIVARYKQLASLEASLFNDTADSWANGAINAVKQANIIDGYGDGTFRPSQNIVRKEFVIMINRMLGRGNIQNIKESIWSDVPVTNFYWADIHEASTTHQYAIYADGLERLKKK